MRGWLLAPNSWEDKVSSWAKHFGFWRNADCFWQRAQESSQKGEDTSRCSAEETNKRNSLSSSSSDRDTREAKRKKQMARDKRKRCASGEDDCQTKVTPPKKKQNRLPAELMLHFIETAHNEGVPSAARAFDVPSTTAYRIVHKWRPSNGFASVQCQKTGPKAGRGWKLTSEVKDWILQQSAADNTLSGPQLATKLKQELNITLHPATINKVLASNRITFKRTTDEAIERNRLELIEERAQFAQAMLHRRLRPDDASAIVYWDECYFETNIVARRARAPKGKPVAVKQAHRGVHFPKDDSKKQDKSKEGMCDVSNPLPSRQFNFSASPFMNLTLLSFS